MNTCLTTLGAISGLTLGGILSTRIGRGLFLRTAGEIVSVIEKIGVTVEPIGEPRIFYVGWLRLDPREFDRQFSLPRLVKDTLLRIVAMKHGRLVSSSLQSLLRGERTEIEFLNGFIVKRAHELGLRLPVNEHLVEMVREIENGDREICAANLEWPPRERS